MRWTNTSKQRFCNALLFRLRSSFSKLLMFRKNQLIQTKKSTFLEAIFIFKNTTKSKMIFNDFFHLNKCLSIRFASVIHGFSYQRNLKAKDKELSPDSWHMELIRKESEYACVFVTLTFCYHRPAGCSYYILSHRLMQTFVVVIVHHSSVCFFCHRPSSSTWCSHTEKTYSSTRLFFLLFPHSSSHFS